MAQKNTTAASQQKKRSAAEKLREHKIEAFRQRIDQDEETIAAMEKSRNDLSKTDINGITVAHRTFGQGRIIEQNASTITVQFGAESKKFMMPSAFIDGFLETDDAELNKGILRYREMCTQIKLAKDDISEVNRSIQVLEKK
ncbi:MAG: hypothetical protein ACI4JK_05865 [Oscillospiraceae bacterium]